MYNLSRMIGEANECLFKLREPMVKFLEKVLPPVFGKAKWEGSIFEYMEQQRPYFWGVIQENNIIKFNELDMAMLLDVFISKFSRLKKSYKSLDDRKYFKYYKYREKFDDIYLTIRIRERRNQIAHPNNNTLTIENMNGILDDFIEFGNYIDATRAIIRSIEVIKCKYSKYQNDTENERKKTERIIIIENEVIRPALNNEELDEDISNSVLTTLFRLRNKKRYEEIDDFFIEAQSSKRGIKVKETLNELGLKAFEDISDEYTKKFIRKEI
jgi:hypothetical protein